MGSSKKHKEKDKDRDRERRREKERKHRDKDRERDRDSEKEKSSRRREERSREKRSHGSEEDVARVDKKKAKREDYDDLYEYAMEESARDDHESSKSQYTVACINRFTKSSTCWDYGQVVPQNCQIVALIKSQHDFTMKM